MKHSERIFITLLSLFYLALHVFLMYEVGVGLRYGSHTTTCFGTVALILLVVLDFVVFYDKLVIPKRKVLR